MHRVVLYQGEIGNVLQIMTFASDPEPLREAGTSNCFRTSVISMHGPTHCDALNLHGGLQCIEKIDFVHGLIERMYIDDTDMTQAGASRHWAERCRFRCSKNVAADDTRT